MEKAKGGYEKCVELEKKRHKSQDTSQATEGLKMKEGDTVWTEG